MLAVCGIEASPLSSFSSAIGLRSNNELFDAHRSNSLIDRADQVRFVTWRNGIGCIVVKMLAYKQYAHEWIELGQMDRIEDCISFLLGKAAQQVARRSRDALAPFGVTPVQYAALRILWERDGLSCAEMGARLLLDSATMTGIVDRLETASLVERRPDPEGDRRINRVYLGHEGRARCQAMNAAMDQVNADVDQFLGQRSAGLRAALALLGEVAPRPAEPVENPPPG